MHSRWLKTRRHFYESLRHEIETITGALTSEILAYQSAYDKIFDKIWDVSDRIELLTKIKISNYVVGGDFHYFYQSQKTHHTVLKLLTEDFKTPTSTCFGRKLILFLEIFNSKDQKKIDDYLKSKLSFEELLIKTKWDKVWSGLPSNGYKRILEWAKLNAIEVIAINDSKIDDLSARDKFSGEIINTVMEKNSGALAYIIYGDFHLALEHLPRFIKGFESTKDIILHLNSDKLYFALSEHAIEDQFDVLTYQNQFCILSSTPWVKLQSYLIYLHQADDQMIADLEEDDIFQPDYTDFAVKIFETFRSDFDLPDWKNDLSILTATDWDFLKLDRIKLNPGEGKKLNYFITSQKNVVFPKDRIQFLAKPSVKSTYSLIGEFIHSKLSQRERLFWSGPIFMKQRVWIEAINCFFTLWLNPRVKYISEDNLESRLKNIFNGPDDKSLLDKTIEFIERYKLIELKALKDCPDLILNSSSSGEAKDFLDWKAKVEAASILGQIRGQKIYKMFKASKINKEVFLNYLSVPLESDRFESMYNHFIKQLEGF